MKTLLKTLVTGLVACNVVVALVKAVQKEKKEEEDGLENDSVCDEASNDVEDIVDAWNKVNAEVEERKSLVKFSRGLFNSIKENNTDLSGWMKATKNMYDAMTRLDDALKRRVEIESKFEDACAKASLSKKDEMT
ncbi:hypothetical protein [Holdemanella biformis]|uniref:Uncharacterized protein n=1 Tax=Holdemanella biformis DSM 3989 TaxID=518637 RepID=B7C8Z7_9FIRM|nr:hypothetical protein [Holdemanella biformis]EEC90768.1 hypothetical protein EUBIFOR_00653 [Holdemanella biformis DSM 3989]